MSWRQPTPADLLDQVAAIRQQAMADAPRDPGVEPWAWDAGRVRESEQAMIDHGLTGYAVAARHDATGQFAALTELCTEAATPDWAFQQITAVLPAHRGHRLGLLVKVELLELLLASDPAVRHVYTGNAGSNAHMIAINEQLGFRIAGTSRSWELSLR